MEFGASLIAIFTLAGLAVWLRLGGNPVLRNKNAVSLAASEVEDGFETERVSIARGGQAALVRDPKGRIMVIKRHGNKFVGRTLTAAARCTEEVDALVVDAGDPHFGAVRLPLSDAPYWADAINRL